MVGIARGLVLAMMIVAGCYSPSARDCAYTCNSGSCPSGLTCVLGFCREEPQPSTSCRGDGGMPMDSQTDAHVSMYRQVVLDDFPVAYWRLGDAAMSTVAVNEVTASANATAAGSVTFGQAGAIMFDTNTAALLDAADSDCMTIGDVATFDFGNNATFTLEAWVKLKGTVSAQARIALSKLTAGTPSGYELAVGTGGGPRLRTCNGTSCDAVNPPMNLLPDLWYHLVGSYNGPGNHEARFYINGSLAAMKTLTIFPPLTAASFALGCRSAGDYFDGFLDELAVYDRVLGDAEVLQHYEAAVPP
jgi:large repetitive protein